MAGGGEMQVEGEEDKKNADTQCGHSEEAAVQLRTQTNLQMRKYLCFQLYIQNLLQVLPLHIPIYLNNK